jgi:hypothetical protein
VDTGRAATGSKILAIMHHCGWIAGRTPGLLQTSAITSICVTHDQEEAMSLPGESRSSIRSSEAPSQFRSGEDNISLVAIQWFSEIRSRTKSFVDTRIAARFNHSDFAVTKVSAVPLEYYDIVDKKSSVSLPI